jgi:hypothetical protein
LICLGSPINITTTSTIKVFTTTTSWYTISLGATPLYVAVKAHHVASIKLLLIHGGVPNLPINDQDKPFLDQAQNELAQEREQLTQTIDDATGNKTFPGELRKLITSYLM